MGTVGGRGKGLRMHMVRKHGWFSETAHLAASNKCSWCGSVLGCKRAVEKHMEKACKGMDCKGQGSSKNKEPDDDKIGEWTCKECNMEVTGNEAIHKHIRWHIERNRERDRESEQRAGMRIGNTISPEIAQKMDSVTRYLRLNQK